MWFSEEFHQQPVENNPQDPPENSQTEVVRKLLKNKNIFKKKWDLSEPEQEAAFDTRFMALPQETQALYLMDLDLLKHEYIQERKSKWEEIDISISDMHSEMITKRIQDIQEEIFTIDRTISEIEDSFKLIEQPADPHLVRRLNRIRKAVQTKKWEYQEKLNTLQMRKEYPEVNQYFSLNELPEVEVVETSQRPLFYINRNAFPSELWVVIHQEPSQEGHSNITVLFNKSWIQEEFKDVYNFELLKFSRAGYFESADETSEYWGPADLFSSDSWIMDIEELFSWLSERKLSAENYSKHFDISQQKIEQWPVGDCYLISALNFVTSHIGREAIISRSVIMDEKTITFTLPLWSKTPTEKYTFQIEDINNQNWLKWPFWFRAIEYLYAQIRRAQWRTWSYAEVLSWGNASKALKDLFGDIISSETINLKALQELADSKGEDRFIFLTVSIEPNNYISFYKLGENSQDMEVTDIEWRTITLYHHHGYFFESARKWWAHFYDPNYPDQPFILPYDQVINYFSHYEINSIDISKLL